MKYIKAASPIRSKNNIENIRSNRKQEEHRMEIRTGLGRHIGSRMTPEHYQRYAFFILLIILAGGVTKLTVDYLTPPGSDDTNDLEESTIHDQAVKRLPFKTDCHFVKFSASKICKVGNDTLYMKPFQPVDSWHESAATPSNTGKISYEAFNRQFVTQVIGIDTVPETSFFKERSKLPKFFKPTTYITSKELPNMRSITPYSSSWYLGEDAFAKWMVAATFIPDLGLTNVGWDYDSRRLILIDLDSHGRRPETTESMVWNTIKWFETSRSQHLFYLYLHDLENMKKIYEEMQHKPLPKYSDHFHLTEERFQELLGFYISVCDRTIGRIKELWLDKPHWIRNPSDSITDEFRWSMQHCLEKMNAEKDAQCGSSSVCPHIEI